MTARKISQLFAPLAIEKFIPLHNDTPFDVAQRAQTGASESNIAPGCRRLNLREERKV
jgi:hypothetical protein